MRDVYTFIVYMRRISSSLLLLLLLIPGWKDLSLAYQSPAKHVLILYEGADIATNYARGDARELAQLLGHFTVDYRLEPIQSYKSGDVNNFDRIFIIGFSKKFDPPDRMMRDLFSTSTDVIWLNTGFDRYCQKFDIVGKYGFKFSDFDTVSNFSIVHAGGRVYTKGEPNLNIITINTPSKVEVLGTAYSPTRKREEKYIVQSGNFMYVADSPFASADGTDRYLYFADLLHDILGQPHSENHRALLRIEDVNAFENPGRLRAIADLLSSKNIPFLVGVIPFYVDPQQEIRISMSEKPDFVDALHYMVAHGATIVMHGVTHQYQGATAVDFEFWDGTLNKPIHNDSKEYVEKKMRMGLDEFWKNNLYPLIWETPHYTATQLDYSVFSEFFNTAMEQRMVIDNPDYSQYYPYIINHDLHGQRLIPETLGYIPDNDSSGAEQQSLQLLVDGARAELGVRDGFASAFIHPVIDTKYMAEYVDSVEALGYTFMDVKEESLQVRLKDRIILTGAQNYELTLEDQYLREIWLNRGEIDHQTISAERINGLFKRAVQVPAGMVYLAEPSEYHQAELSFFEKISNQIKTTWENLAKREESFNEVRAAVLIDPKAQGSAFNNQASFVSMFQALNIPVDTLVNDSLEAMNDYNLIVIPYNTVEQLKNTDYDRLLQYVEKGGNVITDGKNELAQELGIKFANSSLRIERMRDLLYPEDLLWMREPEIMNRFDAERDDDILCVDERTDAPVVIGRQRGNGKFIYIGIRFDPQSSEGYSRFPYVIEYIERYLHLRPVFRRENLEMYFDPGYRKNVSEEDLVKRWVEDGVRRIHVTGWDFYANYTYAYDHLIKLCHANGILVYVWLEPPMVTKKFWDDHPEWREVNYKGQQIPPAWRYLAALTNSQCLAAVKTFYRDMLQSYDWDGVNLAELYFESPSGVLDPATFNPMHVSARDEFHYKYGFDPVQLLDSTSMNYWRKNPAALKKYEGYRIQTLTRLHDEFLSLFDEVKTKKPYLDIIVTIMDDLNNPNLRTYLGVDTREIISLRKRHNFTVQIEDPQTQWSTDPLRYKKIAETYRALVPDSGGLMLDLNIYPFRTENKPTPFPTLVQTGTESFQMIRSAALGADRFTIYSESGVRPQDRHLFSYAASAPAWIDLTDNGWNISTPFPLIAQLPSTISSLELSTGKQLFSNSGRFYLPPGQFSVKIVQQSGAPFTQMPIMGKLFSITGNLKDVVPSNRSIKFNYVSTTRCFASFNHPPYNVMVDGSDYPVESLEGYKRFTVMLPSGEHSVIAVLETGVSYGVDITSFWSSWIIVIFGVFAVAMLFLFYMIIRFSRPAASKK
ncbi:MAG: DUF2334 domain-containing protein [Bacteroidota bacterium]